MFTRYPSDSTPPRFRGMQAQTLRRSAKINNYRVIEAKSSCDSRSTVILIYKQFEMKKMEAYNQDSLTSFQGKLFITKSPA